MSSSGGVAAVAIDAPPGIHLVGSAQGLGGGAASRFVTVFKDATGNPDRIVVVGALNTTSVSVIEYHLVGNTWIHDSAVDALDFSVALNFTNLATSSISAFAIDDPAGSGNRVLFITGNNNAAPDTFEMDSIVLTTGALTATAVVIAGANQPTDTDNMNTLGIPLSTSRVMTLFQDDGHFGDITEAAGTYTFTYTDPKEIAIDTSIAVNFRYSGVLINSQIVLMRSDDIPLNTAMWILTPAGVLEQEFNPFNIAGLASHASGTQLFFGSATMIKGNFAIASPALGTGDASGDEAGYLVVAFPLEDF